MQHECKITVIDKKCFTDYQEQYLEQLQRMAEKDSNRVVRIHCLGAIKAAER